MHTHRHHAAFALLSLLLLGDTANANVAGPIVRNLDVLLGRPSEEDPASADTGTAGAGAGEGDGVKKESLAERLDTALGKEFRSEEAASQMTKSGFNETLAKGTSGTSLEYVVKVSKHKKVEAEEPSVDPGDALNPEKTSTESKDTSDEFDPEAIVEDSATSEEQNVEQDVDRLIDADDNEYVLSKTRAGATLTLDPLFVQDLTIVLSASASMGALFEALRQPVINGYILAGSLVGPGGLALVKEMVQVESLAQVGVQLLLFGLGMEFSMEKMRVVGGVAILGGFLQIMLFIVVAAAGAVAIGGQVFEGVFVGALISMSSTSVVIKALGTSNRSAASQIVIGTLILQDCSVGLMFALMPVLSSLNNPKSGLDPEATGAIVLVILKVILKLAGTVVATMLLTNSLLPPFMRAVSKRCSAELFQMTMVAYCLCIAWMCGHLGLSHELGAFLAGVMISSIDQHETVLHSTEQIRNVFTGLFLASIGLIVSPRFILEHFVILFAGAIIVLVIKSALITLVVWNFGYPWKTSLAVGISLAQVGEFAFVLLSMASQLGLVNTRLGMLLLGVTAISLMMTPLVLNFALKLMDSEASTLPLLAPQGSPKGGSQRINRTGDKKLVEHVDPLTDRPGVLQTSGSAHGQVHPRNIRPGAITT